MEDFRYLFPDINVAALTADREFVGTDWFEYLLDEGTIPFRIRICEGEVLFDGQQTMNGKRLIESLKGESVEFSSARGDFGDHWVHSSQRYCSKARSLCRDVEVFSIC